MPEAVTSPSTADRSLLRAFRAWGGSGFEHASGRFSPAWRDRLRSAWLPLEKTSAAEAHARLQHDHEASSRPDPSRVHPSWFVRALRSESRAVQLAVTAHAPASIRQELRRGLKLEPRDLEPDHPPDPEALGWALALWAERLVGDVPDLDDDPPVVVAMTRLGSRGLARLVKVCGLVKHAFAIDGNGLAKVDESTARLTSIDRVRLGFFRRLIGEADPRLVPPARVDLEAIGGDWRRGHGRVGLLTFGRLLGAVEAHRARWASQHVPYSIVRGMRIKEAPALPHKALLAWESWVLEAAWARLLSEGRLDGNRQDANDLETGASP